MIKTVKNRLTKPKGAKEMKKIGFVNAKAGTLSIFYDEKERYNHYKVYRTWSDRHPETKKLRHHKMLIEKYGDLLSCTILINDWVKNHNEDGIRKF